MVRNEKGEMNDREKTAATASIPPPGNSREVCAVLDGEVRPTGDGFDCVGSGKALFVPYHCCATDPTHAMLLCRQSGLVTSKLNAMDPARAWVVYLLTPPRPEPVN
jgi:hypothetical protein